jgi:hypothetical protein
LPVNVAAWMRAAPDASGLGIVTWPFATSELRRQGVSDPSEVERAYLEADGQISVIKALS